jgi:hypothetical protein
MNTTNTRSPAIGRKTNGICPEWVAASHPA